MLKESKRYSETGGWGFESFQGDSRTERRLNAEGRVACFQFPAPQKDRDFVVRGSIDEPYEEDEPVYVSADPRRCVLLDQAD